MRQTDISEKNLKRLQEQAARAGLSVDAFVERLLDAAAPAPPSQIPYKMLLDNTTDTISLLDLELRYVYANPIVGKLMGYDPAEMIGKTDAELGVPAENVQFFRSAWDKVIETDTEQIIDFEYDTSEGLRAFESRLTPIYDEDGTLVYLLAITRDVTQRKHSELMLRDITRRLPGMILTYILKPDGTDRVPFVSEGINALYELSVEDALADVSKVWAKVHPDDLEGFAKSIQESAQTLSVWDYEWRIRMSDGSLKWVAGLGTPRSMDDGSVIWNTLLLDITERKQLQQRQQELLEQLKLAIETSGMGIWQLDLETNVLEWNEQQLAIYGVTPQAFNHELEDWRSRVHPEDLPTAEQGIAEALEAGSIFNVNFRIIRDDGAVRYLTGSARILRDDEGQPQSMLGCNLDITEIKQAEQVTIERERLQANLNLEKERIATFQRIVAKLAHDIRTPLSVISTSRQILSDYFEQIDSDQRQRRLENIGKQLTYVTELLNDLNLIEEMSPQSRPLMLAPHNLKALCHVTLQDVQTSVGKQHRFSLVDELTPDTVLIDDVLINRILLNLLSNAVKYSPEGSKVTLALREQDNAIRLQVRDQGMGISEDDLQKVFDPFYRVQSVQERIAGNGLGLSIVRDCVEALGGQISVESQLKVGTTFTVTLPLIVPGAAASA